MFHLYHFSGYVFAAFASVIYYIFVKNLFAAALVFPGYLTLFGLFISIHRNLIGIAKDGDKGEVLKPLIQIGNRIWLGHILALLLSFIGVYSANQIYVEAHQNTFKEELGSVISEFEEILVNNSVNPNSVLPGRLRQICNEGVRWSNKVFNLNFRNRLPGPGWSDPQKRALEMACDTKSYVVTNCKGRNILHDVNVYEKDAVEPCDAINKVMKEERKYAPTPP